MRLVAIMNWFDEQPEWLAAAVSSLSLAHVDHLITVDGPYALYPNSMKRWRSPLEQHQAILCAAYGAGIGLTMHQQRGPWLGNEIEKRNMLFDLGRTLKLTHEDWFFIIDSDETVTYASHDLKDKLSNCEPDQVGYYLLQDGETPNYIRGLYRYHPDLCLTITHYGFRHGENGPLLWDGGGQPAANLTDHLQLEHRQRGSQTPRFQNKWAYYNARDEMGIERIPSQAEA